MASVTVYYFTAWPQEEGDTLLSKRPATLGTIRQVNGGLTLGTPIEIDESELDENGFRRDKSPQ
jgi:hypothetical protein